MRTLAGEDERNNIIKFTDFHTAVSIFALYRLYLREQIYKTWDFFFSVIISNELYLDIHSDKVSPLVSSKNKTLTLQAICTVFLAR